MKKMTYLLNLTMLVVCTQFVFSADNTDTGGKGGKWTMMGTNQKAFRVIADKIYSEIKETKIYKDLVAKKIGQ